MTAETREIPIEIRPYLNEIAERLWSNHAAVMVGAGFSKNALKSNPSSKDAPNWNELGDIFYEKLYNKTPSNNYLNVLKLADEVQAAFGRPVLDQLLMNNIRDKDFEPSRLHIKLLELPWTDVFTTNYDTLLERTCEHVLTQKFDVVINKEDLVYSRRPRIIKLHGSFPSERPLIITEEDYRNYPRHFSPFVNTVQQSLLENTLCLLGFSGDDPNFLQWIGWINDNLGKENAPQIYLIGILNLSEAQQKLLKSKNIALIDLSFFSEADGDHGKALYIFLEFLFNEKAKLNNFSWPSHEKYFIESSSSHEEIITAWKNTRLSYPNWVILPEEKRKTLWAHTSDLASNTKLFDKLEIGIDLSYIYELNWRLEKCLFPIYNDVAVEFQKILNRYNPFPVDLPNATGMYFEAIQSKNSNWKDFANQWLEISLSLLRYYREEGYSESWVNINNILQKVKTYLNPDQIAKFYYEKTSQALNELDLKLATENLDFWPENEQMPFWEARKAALLAEIGQIDRSEKIIEKSLHTIRKRLNLSPVKNDYGLVSQEAYIMFLNQVISGNKNILNKIYEISPFNDRWNYLTQYECDPWSEKKYFDLVLQQPRNNFIRKEKKIGFDVGASSVTYNLNPSDTDAFNAYSFLRFIEETGMPLSFRHVNFDIKTMNGAIERLASASPNWAKSIMIRYGRKDLVETFLNRDLLSKLKVEEIDIQIELYVNKFYELLPDRQLNPNADAFIEKVLVILSRLVVKSNEETKIKLYSLIQFVYQKELILNGSKELLLRLVNSSNKDLQIKILPIIFDVPFFEKGSYLSQLNFIEPAFVLNLIYNSSDRKIKIKNSLIVSFFEQAYDRPKVKIHVLARLIYLYRAQLLSKAQEKQLFNLIWEEVDPNNGFPIDSPFRFYEYMSYPHPRSIDPEKLFRNYIITSEFEVQSKSQENGISMEGGKSKLTDEICGGSATIHKTNGIFWTEVELTIIWSKCKNWWDLDMNFLSKYEDYKDEFFGSVYEEFRARFSNINRIISTVFGYQQFNLFNEIKDLIHEMDMNKIPVLQSKSAFLELFYSNKESFFLEIETNIQSRSHEKRIDALNACLITLKQENAFSNDIEFNNELLELLCQPLKWRCLPVMKDCLDVFINLIKYQPKINFEPILQSLLSCLKFIHQETKNHDSDFFTTSEKLTYKKTAIHLALAIHINLYKNDNSNLPEEIICWKDVAEDKNEFGDIVIQWEK